VGSAPLADVPSLHELPRLIRLKYMTPTNRWTTLGSPPVARLSDAPLNRSRLWRELLSGYGVTDVVSVVFRDAYGCWGFLDLWRCGPVFDETATRTLTSIVEAVTTGLRKCQATGFADRPIDPGRVEPVVLMLSPDLVVLGQTPSTHDYLRTLVPPAPDRAPVPASAYNVGAQLLAVEAGVDANPPTARVHLAGGHWLTLRAARLGADTIAVTIEDTSPADRIDLFGRVFGLTVQERLIVGHLAGGLDTKTVAERMFLSAYTVQDHLKSIFAKTGAHSRRELIALALGA
jgi:DNA-binding CsgD family transcriptional regulator